MAPWKPGLTATVDRSSKAQGASDCFLTLGLFFFVAGGDKCGLGQVATIIRP
jgi:hypothetical protein